MRIILASNSPRRKEILSQVGLDFKVIPSSFEENETDMPPDELVNHFAYMKALDVYEQMKGSETSLDLPKDGEVFVVGADTIVFYDRVLGKPKDKEDAYRMLSSLSGKEHYVMTGVSVIAASTGKAITDYEQTRVSFKELTDEEINKYIESGEVFDKAGAYAIQGIGSLFVSKIEGCYFNVVGFPIHRFSIIMKDLGYSLLK